MLNLAGNTLLKKPNSLPYKPSVAPRFGMEGPMNPSLLRIGFLYDFHSWYPLELIVCDSHFKTITGNLFFFFSCNIQVLQAILNLITEFPWKMGFLAAQNNLPLFKLLKTIPIRDTKLNSSLMWIYGGMHLYRYDLTFIPCHRGLWHKDHMIRNLTQFLEPWKRQKVTLCF